MSWYIKDGATTGLAALNRYDFEFSMLSSLALIRPDSSLASSHFLVAWLNNPRVRERLLEGISGAAIQRFTIAKIKNFEVPLPPLELQIQFAGRAEGIHRARAAHQSALVGLDALFASIQARAFSNEPAKSKEVLTL